MKFAFALDYVLADLDSQLIKWRDRLQIEGEPFSTKKLLGDEIFWATIKPMSNAKEVAEFLWQNKIEYIVLTERPKKLSIVTNSWLRRNGFIPEVIYGSIKRFDCRANGVTHIFDRVFPDLEFYEYEDIEPVMVEDNLLEKVLEIYEV